MSTFRSSDMLQGDDGPFYRSLFKAMGYTGEELKDAPLIGVADSGGNLSPGHVHLHTLADHAIKGIYRGGGTAVPFGLPAMCDGIAQGHEGMKYILPSREVICDAVEVAVEAHRLDAVVLIGSCDKVIPGMAMAAARLNIPAIMLTGGPMAGGPEFDGRKMDLTSLSEAKGMLKAGKIRTGEYSGMEDHACPGCGSCSFLGTANTMASLVEALGLSLPGSALVPATHAERQRIAFRSGTTICEMARKGITANNIISPQSIENAVVVCQAINGSTNAVLHLAAIAYEAGLDIDVIDLFEKSERRTPQLARVNPAAKWDMEDFWKAGGIPRVMKNLASLLHLDALSCVGESFEKVLDNADFYFPADDEVIKGLESPFSSSGGVAVIRGNLCPESAVSKPGAIHPDHRFFVGTAKVFDCEEEAEEALLDGKIEKGTVIVIRYEGPKGGPGMREMYKAMKYVYGLGLQGDVAIVTDGRFSGTNNGCFVGHISPEAADGGPIAVVRDGDKITIDIPNRGLELNITPEELENRLAGWTRPALKYQRGVLGRYGRSAKSAHFGAVLKSE